MRVLLFGASGRIGQRIANELLDRGHEVTGVSRSGEVEGVEDEDFEAVAGDATDPDRVAELVSGHDAVASALGPTEDQDVDVLPEMARAVVEGMGRTDVDRLVWTGGAGALEIEPGTRLIDSEQFPEAAEPVARAAIEALEFFRGTEDLDWLYVAPATFIEPGERTGEYRTAEGELVVDEDGESYVTMEDFAIAFADELERGDRSRVTLGVGY